MSGASKSVFARKALVGDGWEDNVRITIDGAGRISSVEPQTAADSNAYTVDVLLPAQSNLHSHTFQRAMAGLSEARSPAGRDSFWTWREIMYRFLDILDPDDIEAIAAFAFVEMLESGYGSVAEFHYVHHQPGGQPYANLAELSERIAAAANATGIGLTLLPVAYAQGGVDGRALAGGQLRFGNDLERYVRLAQLAEKSARKVSQDAGFGVAPHSIRAVNERDLKTLEQRFQAMPFHIHIAEQIPEIEEVQAAYGQRSMSWLLDHLPVNQRWCLIHSTHMTAEETNRVAASGAVAGLCPVTEANLGDGIFNGVNYLNAGGRFGTGSDSNIRISPSEELRQLEYSQRLRDVSRVTLSATGKSCGRTLYDASLAGGAQALGRESGSLAPGQWADMIALDVENAALFGLEYDRLLDGWIFAGDRQAVSDVWSAGRHVVHEGRHRDRNAIFATYKTRLASILEKV
ncbi:formimidoylglutamate deiminase [Phyllobacterium lublinensis]|uniref:formimidoylglutamate deiminase n=1 Tax=Phyllobacterium lublinensis TaxID=2875708 RepID=UPI001CCC7FDF|nr:formimidoylglutamate deiminase [Phyllobacterium sp. 2063]MBZ9653937.1 formimidoylglutamate deiminase [Phyllobacterium sp. 2063]